MVDLQEWSISFLNLKYRFDSCRDYEKALPVFPGGLFGLRVRRGAWFGLSYPCHREAFINPVAACLPDLPLSCLAGFAI